MATSIIKKNNSEISQSVNIQTGVNVYRRGNVITLSVSNVNITNTSSRTNLGTLPTGWEPPYTIFARDISSYGSNGNAMGYIDANPNGTIEAFKTIAGVVTATLTWGIV